MNHEEKPAPQTLRELLEAAARPVRELFAEPLPRGVGYWHVTGSLCLFLVILQALTGILMAFYYSPSTQTAWESVNYVDGRLVFGGVNVGRLIHGLHHWGSSAFVVMVVVHILRVFGFGAYKGPRRWTWIVGVGLLGVAIGFGFTGYLLPWDMKAYFGTQVGTGIAGMTPVIGPQVQAFLLGGEEIGELTLTRFYAIHVLILPIALVALLGVHLFLIRAHGITPPWRRVGDETDVERPTTFYPAQAVRDSSAALLMLLLLMGLAWKWGGNLQPKADPTSATFAPHPEWYFLGFQQLLRYFGEWFADEHQSIAQPLAAVVIPGLLILVMLLLPFIDRNPERRIGKRPIAISLAGFVVVSMVFLTIRGYASLLHERRELAALAAASAPELDPTPAPAAPADPGAPLVFDEDELALGRRLYQVLECADCHVGPRVGRDLNIPPALEYAGDRFTPRWTIDYLREVPPRRWQRENRRPLERMPDFRFTDAELRAMTGHVMTFAEPEKFERSDFDWSDSTPEKIAQGRELYQLENCASCHKIGEEGVDNGPNLAGAGDRLRAAFMFDIIKSPQRLIPGTAMQDTLMTDEEVEALTYYLMTLK